MEGEAAAAILKVLVENLIDHSKKEISLIRGLEKDAEKLTGSLDTIQKFLNEAEMQTIPGEAVKGWLKRLEDAAFDADNVLDELNYHLLSNKIMKPMKKNKVLSCCPSFNHFARQRKMALKIKEIYVNLESINKEATELGLVGRFANAPTLPADAGVETDSFTVDPIFIGRDDDVSEIVEMLTTDEHVFSILPVVGMGGLGKTTLARKVFNHEKIKTQFGSHIWVHVSQNFDPIILFMRILSTLTSNTDGVESREVILKKLQEAMKDKTYLLVLDDVWNQDIPKWEDFMNSLSGVTSMKGNGIIVTTRNMEVASIVKPLHIHRLDGLSEEDCWSIIKAKTFGSEIVPSQFEAIGRKISKGCQGLPLAANVVGGVLQYKSEEEWLDIEQKWLSDVGGDNINKILRLSFDKLPSPSLKRCFAYCSVFPKGDRLVKREVIELWMAEGFLQPDDGRINGDMESAGDKYFKALLQSSLLQDARRDDYGNVTSCVMHDLVHNLASSILGSSSNAVGITRVRYMIHEHESSRIPKEVAKYLRTLFFQGEISGTMFSHLECLHALTLRSYKVEELPSSIGELIHLRNLNISNTAIKSLPKWVGDLHHLQTLRADGRSLRKLPSTLAFLVNLRHLYITSDVELPAKIGRLTSLRTLTHFPVGSKNGGCKIEELGSLNNLKGKLEICNLEEVHDKEEAEKANLFKKSKLVELEFTWDRNREGETNDESVLEGLQPHHDLNKLEIWGFRGKRFPLWTLKMAVRNVPQGSWVGLEKLMKIRLYRCQECEEIPMLGHLPKLKSLYLEYLSNVKSINSSFYGIHEKETSSVFPALERLELYEMPKLTEWADVDFATESEVKVFPHLEYLEIKECKQLRSAPSLSSSCLEQLQICSTANCMALANICGSKLTSLTKLHLQGLDGAECLPDGLFYKIQNLSELTISGCPKLREVADGLHTLNSLEELIIRDCPNLKWIIAYPSSQGSFTSLGSLEIRECPELMDLPCEMIESLQTLTLVGLRSLKNLPRLIGSLTKSPRLSNLEITGVPEFMATTSVEIRPFPRLRRLEIDVSMEWSRETSAAIHETVDGILQGCCHSLHSLDLKGLEIWECLPRSIQHLTSLSALTLENFGVVELPEWFGNLSSLARLRISDCKELRHLPSVDAMKRLTKLNGLEITGCPKLGIDQQRQSDDNPEWHKISHIPKIMVQVSPDIPFLVNVVPGTVGFKVPIRAERNDSGTYTFTVLDIRVLQISTFDMKKAEAQKLQDSVALCTEYFKIVFPLDTQQSLFQDMISLKENRR